MDSRVLQWTVVHQPTSGAQRVKDYVGKLKFEGRAYRETFPFFVYSSSAARVRYSYEYLKTDYSYCTVLVLYENN